MFANFGRTNRFVLHHSPWYLYCSDPGLLMLIRSLSYPNGCEFIAERLNDGELITTQVATIFFHAVHAWLLIALNEHLNLLSPLFLSSKIRAKQSHSRQKIQNKFVVEKTTTCSFCRFLSSFLSLSFSFSNLLICCCLHPQKMEKDMVNGAQRLFIAPFNN